ncbi:MAG: hypothetical protein HYZ53_29170 [Planctomycetes bacterium]|nr:hypothetical protein [Planctomycetota bacterium]
MPVIGLGDVGVFVGLVTAPVGRDRVTLVQEAVRPLFDRRRTNLEASISAPLDDGLYVPHIYSIFSDWDLLVVAALDGATFALRDFNAFNGFVSDPEKDHGFQHQSLFGFVPLLPSNRECPGAPPPDALTAVKTFLATAEQLPILTMTQLKLNPVLMMRGGFDFLRWVQLWLNYKVATAGAVPCSFLQLQSMGWNEITLLIASKSFAESMSVLDQFREESVNSLFAGWPSHAQAAAALHWVDSVFDHSTRNCHLFDAAWTTAGFRFELFERWIQENERERIAVEAGAVGLNISHKDRVVKLSAIGKPIAPPDEKDRCHFTSLWTSRPGHLGSLLDPRGQPEVRLTLGKFDFIHPEFAMREMSSREVIAEFVAKACGATIRDHALKTYSLLGQFLPYGRPLPPVAGDHYYYHREMILPLFRISSKDRESIRNSCRKLALPDTVTTRLLGVISNYNDGIDDRLLYADFVDLAGFVDRLAEDIRLRDCSKRDAFVEQLDEALRRWGHAYANRIHTSPRFSQERDVNPLFRGAVQQVATALTGAYDILCQAPFHRPAPWEEQLGIPPMLATISGTADVMSDRFALELSPRDAFHPESFATVVGHEVGHVYYENFYRMETWIEYCLPESPLSFEDVPPPLRELSMEIGRDRRVRVNLTKRLLREVAADVFNLAVMFGFDARLFLDAYWFNFLQSRSALASGSELLPNDGPEHVRPVESMTVLLRLCLAVCLSRPATGVAIWGDWLESVHHLPFLSAEVAASFQRPMSNPYLNYLVSSYANMANSAFEAAYETQDVNATTARLSMRVEVKRALIQRGEVPLFNPNDESQLTFVSTLCRAYLTLLLPLPDPGGRRKKIWLVRESDGNRRRPTPGSSFADFLADPFGGTFSWKPETRREYFKWRAATLSALWDVSLKRRCARVELRKEKRRVEDAS